MRVKPLTAAEKRSRPKKQNHAIKRITPEETAAERERQRETTNDDAAISELADETETK